MSDDEEKNKTKSKSILVEESVHLEKFIVSAKVSQIIQQPPQKKSKTEEK